MAAKKRKGIYVDWLRTVSTGEFIGFIIPSIAGVFSVASNTTQVQQFFFLVLAGLGEGIVLGFAQSRVLKRIIPKMKPFHWIRATVLGAGYAWVVGMLPSTLFEYIKDVPFVLLIPIGVFLGITLLLSIGFAQYLVLKQYVKNASNWIWINVLAWLVGLTVLFIFMTLAPEGTIPTLLFSILGGLGMAVTMAAITGRFIRSL